MTRVPSVRRPSSFFDVFTVTAGSIALVLAIWRGSFVRVEMGAFTLLLFGWVAWAVNRILSESIREEERTRGDSSR